MQPSSGLGSETRASVTVRLEDVQIAATFSRGLESAAPASPCLGVSSRKRPEGQSKKSSIPTFLSA